MQIAAALAHQALDPKLIAAVRACMRGHRVVIVRSSAVAEDSAGTSLAGHFDSIVCQNTARDVERAIKGCLLSGLFVLLDLDAREDSPAALLARAVDGLALIVQPVLDAERSGVVFSRSPVHPDAALVVASYGTCHAVVDGALTSDTWAVGDDDTVHEEPDRQARHERAVS